MVLDRFSSFLILVSTLWSVNKKLKRAFENLKKKKKKRKLYKEMIIQYYIF